MSREQISNHFQADVLIVTAVKEEYDEARKVNTGAMDEWIEDHESTGFEVALRTYRALDGRPIRIALTWTARMRATATVEAAGRLIDRLGARCLAMCGVCAGRRDKVRLGDIIIGSLLYTYDTGAMRADYADEKQRHECFQADPDPWPLDERWLHRAQAFQPPPDVPWRSEQPLTLEAQGNWLLERLRAGEDSLKHPDRKLRCPAWEATISRLRKRKLLKRQAPLTMTAAGRAHIDNLLLLHPDGLPEEPALRIRVAPIATGSNVMRDPLLFDRLSGSMREVLGVEMEAAAVAAIAHARRVPWIVMKGVMDFADHDKDDQFKSFAARASAECLIAFLRENLPKDDSGRAKVSSGAAGRTAAAQVSTPILALGKLPHSSGLLIGRDPYLRQLDAAWDGPIRRHVLVIVAWGGTGKTALVNHWLVALAPNYLGARRVLGWSFYSQGTSEERGASADEFVAWALRVLDDSDPAAGSPFDKASRLARLVRQERTLLVLDGVEPLQYPPGPDEGRFKDHAFAAFLRDLCASNPGMCIVTSRIGLMDLAQHEGRTAETVDLSQLDPDAGAELLHTLGVCGQTDEVRQAVGEFGGHALALTLLGQYLADICGGDVRRRREVGPLEHEDREGGQARRMMVSYEQWFQEGPERDILHVLGLFDRPAQAEALATVRAKPAIPGLTEYLVDLSDLAWTKALSRLRRARLIETTDPVDAHPLVREHFGEALRKDRPTAWQEGHRRLYEHYRTAVKELPETLEEMGPLYAAVTHGCHAGLHQQVLDEVYWPRICRGDEFYSLNKLGAIGADMAAVAGFFAAPWGEPMATLSASARAMVLGVAGFNLRAQGRLREAIAPMAASLVGNLAQDAWKNATIAARNLSQLHLSLGEVTTSLAYAGQCVDLAERSGDAFHRMASRVTLADPLYQAGRVKEAERRFVEAEEMQKELQPKIPLLYSLGGYWYCDLLLGRGAVAEVVRRAEQAMVIARQNSQLLSIALDQLSLGRAHLAAAQAGDASSRSRADQYLDQAVAGLHVAGTQHELPRGFLARADFFLFTGDHPRARADLDGAMEIALRSSMRLHQADAHLGYARLYLATGDRAEARTHLDQARALIQATGYLRRQPEVDDLNAQLARHMQLP